ncbi:AraC family transcriptional regulator [Bradyrhizobium acaciae]|uniref:AraC family transcriptional regulator n=1 Tax=Bradyrhizobium acaciae TaxID=2683706 RepID=UPI001E5870DD|nr:AraC family transcriptional regulator [Bradyrhizobium acaciae]MCC8979295.1 AraC family transcriptional regulator [Bradyrhizobium acaciae]
MAVSTAFIADRLFDAKHLVLASGDLDEVVEGCSRMLRPHDLAMRGRRAKLAARLHHLPIGPISLNRLRYGGDVTVVPELSEEGNFLVTLPVQGSAQFRYGSAVADVTPGRGTIVGPYREFRLDIEGAFDQILLRLDRRRVEVVCASLLGSDKAMPVHFDLTLREMPAFWHKLEAAAGLSTFGEALAYPKMFVQLEELIVESLLVAQPNNFSGAIAAANGAAPSAQVRKAMDYMRQHIADAVSLGQVARHCGLSLRSLQAGFQRDLGTSPSRWLRAQRLDRVHAILLSSEPGSVAVTEVALQCGFFHLGDFSARFKERFGEKPSAVLAKHRS